MENSLLKDRLIKNYFSFSIGSWINALISFFTVPIISWLINPTEFGKATMFSTVYSMLSMLTLIGVPSGLMRLYHQIQEREKLFWNSLIIPLSLSVISTFFLLIFKTQINQFLVGEKESTTHVVLIFMLFLGGIQTINETMIRMQGKGLKYSTLQVIRSISNFIFVILYALFFQRNFFALLYGQLFSVSITLLVGFFFQREYWLPIKLDKTLLKEIFLFSYPFLFVELLWWLLGWTDRVILRMYSSFTEIGLYSTAFKLVSVMNLFTIGFKTFWYPFAYEQYEKNPSSKIIFRKIFNYVSFIMFGIAFTILCTKSLIFLLFEKNYRSAAYIAPFLLLNPLATVINTVTARGIDFTKKTYWFIISRGVAVVFNFIGNILLIPILGAKGAALTTGLSYTIVLGIEWFISEKLYKVGYNYRKVYFIFFLYFTIAAINTFLQNSQISILYTLTGFGILCLIYKDVFYNSLRIAVEIVLKVVSVITRKK